MRIEQLGNLRAVLETASKGRLAQLAEACAERGLELHVYVLTEQEGLAPGQMLLCLHAMGPAGTATLLRCELGPAQRKLGWNLYLQDRMCAARDALDCARSCLAKLD